MLILGRKTGQAVVLRLADGEAIVVQKTRKGLAIIAPDTVRVLRAEVADRPATEKRGVAGGR